jgi:ubiquitin thioesterase protein OTUB1
MIGDVESPTVLAEEYQDAEGYLQGIAYLTATFPRYRRIRGDGNCFYRAFLFSYLERLQELKVTDAVAADTELARMQAKVAASKVELVAVGYQETVFETFSDRVDELLGGLFSSTRAGLVAAFQEGGEGDYYTWYMRLLTGCAMKRDKERFLPFIENGCDLDGFVSREVEPMGKEV